MLQLIQCLKRLLEPIALCIIWNCTSGIYYIRSCPYMSAGGCCLLSPNLLRGFDGNINSYHSWRWQRGMVLGCSEGSESRAVKCSALAASLAAPYTASDPLYFPPNSAASHQLVFSGGGCGISGWGEGNILFSLSWLVYLYREKVNLAQVLKEKSL